MVYDVLPSALLTYSQPVLKKCKQMQAFDRPLENIRQKAECL
jgi:hypothetical protein